MTTRPDDDSLAMLSAADLCRLWGLSRSTIDRMVARGDLPRPRRVGARLRWLRSEIAGYLKEAS